MLIGENAGAFKNASHFRDSNIQQISDTWSCDEILSAGKP